MLILILRYTLVNILDCMRMGLVLRFDFGFVPLRMHRVLDLGPENFESALTCGVCG